MCSLHISPKITHLQCTSLSLFNTQFTQLYIAIKVMFYLVTNFYSGFFPYHTRAVMIHVCNFICIVAVYY